MASDGSAVTGRLLEQALEDLHMQEAFLSCIGFSIEHGLTEVHLPGAHLERNR